MKETASTIDRSNKTARGPVGAYEERMLALEEALRETHDLYRGALADFDNYRKRMAQQKTAVEKSAKKAILLPLLEVTDSIERAFAHKAANGESCEKWIQGIYLQLLDILKRNRVDQIQTVGQGFDPRYHDAVEMISTDNRLSGSISKEFRKGYLMDGELLRPARVQVVE